MDRWTTGIVSMCGEPLPDALRGTVYDALVEYEAIVIDRIHRARRLGREEAAARAELELANIRAARASEALSLAGVSRDPRDPTT